ncbi:DNA sulfur modification protein DndE [Pseudomonas aeruginosa]|uniref:DNA sulfur modification protein DndE n=1 Tax=Pseudomonas aeruginosa TaxID=287 RepID=UPI0008FB69B5|nr:DNA sulfur modification protein DndE [Pseudomonas aeruginosa]MCC4282039.1 DNA sulfur modification protein DndE [Pseudomonas aeruginosa]MEC4074667.1 DNA sulfur modification protein DndE [Pseudomonas aeruginosa]OPE00776.1 DNA sulfur modification protein DndE [Pseudomonas aeruginosa]HEJ2265354.1 DNA sulfur modification protein DndE [Pseudomonas aeruginosa]HEP9713076.1 DNA sulfur modification protein DndE [Pseudomonas aeruginosa]
MIDRIRLTASAKTQLSTLKRRTGIDHYNALCRHALCVSLANDSQPPEENLNFNGGLEIDWKVLSGGNEELYLNLIYSKYGKISDSELKRILTAHFHRGLSYMVVKDDIFSGI